MQWCARPSAAISSELACAYGQTQDYRSLTLHCRRELGGPERDLDWVIMKNIKIKLYKIYIYIYGAEILLSGLGLPRQHGYLGNPYPIGSGAVKFVIGAFGTSKLIVRCSLSSGSELTIDVPRKINNSDNSHDISIMQAQIRQQNNM